MGIEDEVLLGYVEKNQGFIKTNQKAIKRLLELVEDLTNTTNNLLVRIQELEG